ncbi:MAG TPA: MmgE/PrpD family protein [Chloroflexota bacterium]|nr:MmgE/PrpD family protein [Chloroflexota bacterium]
MTVEAPAADIARFCTELRFGEVPPRVRERTKDILLDSLASALAGHDASESKTFQGFAAKIAQGSGATVIGGENLSPAAATMVNGYLITAVTVCDIHRATHCHVTPEVVPPALAVAEQLDSEGAELLLALTLGLEVTTRIGLALKPDVFRGRGWHAPGVAGPFGAAVAAGRLLSLDPAEFRSAFGLAGSQAAGSYAQLRTPTIKFQQARGALSGLLAAWLASRGFTSAQEILLHPDGGLLRTHTDGGDPDAAVDGLGERWELENISLRAWPVAVQLQPLVTSLMELIERYSLQAEAVSSVSVDVSDIAYQLHGEVDWSDRFRARLSVAYVTGIVLTDHRCWLEQFTPERVQDVALGRFIRESITVRVDPGLPEGTVRVNLVMRDGSRYEDRRSVARGEPSAPLTRSDIREKFLAAASGILNASATRDVIEQVESLEDVPHVGELVRRLRRQK